LRLPRRWSATEVTLQSAPGNQALLADFIGAQEQVESSSEQIKTHIATGGGVKSPLTAGKTVAKLTERENW